MKEADSKWVSPFQRKHTCFDKNVSREKLLTKKMKDAFITAVIKTF